MIEIRRIITKVTQWKDGCVYKTQNIGEIWVDDGLTVAEENAIAKKHGGDMLTCLPTSELAKGYDTCYRTKK